MYVSIHIPATRRVHVAWSNAVKSLLSVVLKPTCHLCSTFVFLSLCCAYRSRLLNASTHKNPENSETVNAHRQRERRSFERIH